jgi:multiple sugar transport system permease protein
VAGVVTFLTVVIATLTAYAFSRYRFRFKNPLNVFIISTQTVPPITLLIPWSWPSASSTPTSRSS